MNGPKDLLAAEDNWVTDIGASFPGERVVARGKDMFTEFADFSWHKYLLYMITGREFGDNELRLLDQFWMLTISYPDPRIWNNRIAALAATVRSTAALGVGSAYAVSEAKIYGGQPNLAAIDFILEAKRRIVDGEELADIVKKELKVRRMVAGYGRPIIKSDERIAPIQKLMKETGYDKGEHVQLSYEVENILMNGRWRMQMNITGLFAAVGADMGFSVQEYYLWLTNGFTAGIVACYTDAVSKKEGTLFPLRCERVAYNGSTKRGWD